MLGRYDRAMRARQPVGRLTLLQQAIAAIRRNNGALFYVPQNFSGAWTDSAGTDRVNEVEDVLGLLGDHTQPTIARRNLLTWTQGFENAVWAKDGTAVSANSGVAPDGTLTADKVTPIASNVLHRVVQNGSSIAGSSGVSSVRVKADGYSKIALREAHTTGLYAAFDLANGSVIESNAAGRSITPIGGGWFEVSMSVTGAATQAFSLNILPASYAAGSPTFAWAGDGTSGIYIWGAQLEQGTTATPYQRIDAGQGEWLSGNYTTNTAAWQATTANKPLVRRVPKLLGPNLVVNGTFDSAAGWTTPASWTIGSGVATGAATSSSLFSPATGIEAGKYYKITFDITAYTSGNCAVTIGQNYGGQRLANGVGPKSFVIQATNTARGVEFYGGSFTGAIDNVVVQEVLEWSYAMSFDGSNDSLTTNITTGNEGWVCAGVTPANMTTAMSIVNAGEGVNTIPGVWLFASGGGSWCASAANGTVRAQVISVMTGVRPQVVSMGWDASNISVGVDNVEASTARTGSCASGANVLRIGQYQGSSIPFNGSMHAVAYAPVLPSAADRAIIRKWIGSLQGQTL